MHVRELMVRYRIRRLAESPTASMQMRDPKDVAGLFQTLLSDEVVEVGMLLCLSTRCHLLAYHELSRGTVDSTMMHPREVFKAALLANASFVVLGHNHPSGDVSPSADDRAVTSRIAAAGLIMGIELVDHVIVSEGSKYFSFKEAGLL